MKEYILSCDCCANGFEDESVMLNNKTSLLCIDCFKEMPMDLIYGELSTEEFDKQYGEWLEMMNQQNKVELTMG
jgi:hypothetical protein